MESDFVFEQLNRGPCRTYLIGSKATREAALVDPLLGSSPDYVERLASEGFSLRYVIDTHTHADHLSGGRLLQERTGCEYAMHRKAGARHVSRRLSDGDVLKLGSLVLELVETPGHTKDSLSLLIPGRILTGDWLFIGGAGRTDLPGGDPAEHWESLERVVPSLAESTIVSPGHDYENRIESALSEEKRSNANLRPRAREAYVAWLEAGARPTPEWMIDTIRANNDGATDPTLSYMPEDAAAACMCQPAASSPAVAEVSVDEVMRLTETAGERLLLDVRQPEEFAGELGHVPGALLIPLPELPARLLEIERYRDKRVVTICRSGGRSAKAAGLLTGAGFGDVVNMRGGTLAWRERGFPLER